MLKLDGEVSTEFHGRVCEVPLVHDIVAIKHRPGFMAGDVRGDTFAAPLENHDGLQNQRITYSRAGGEAFTETAHSVPSEDQGLRSSRQYAQATTSCN